MDQQVVEVAQDKSATVLALESLVRQINGIDEKPLITLEEIEIGFKWYLGCLWSHLYGGVKVKLEDIPGCFEVSVRTGNLYA